MGLLDKFKKTADEAKDKAEDLAEEHGDKAKLGIDKAADVIDDKTGGKHTEKIEDGADKAKDAIDKLQAEN